MENNEILRDGSTLIFAPLSITSINALKYKELLISNLNECLNIVINLQNTEEFDIAGFQIIKALENYAIINGIKIEVTNISEVINTKLIMIGASI